MTSATTPLLTRAEASAFTETSTHADVLALVDALGALGDARLHISDFGSTPEDRLLPLLVLSEHGHFTPAAAQASGLPVVLILCGIHAGEVEGKEAALMLVRNLLRGEHGDVLVHCTVVVVPLFNPDGNDRLSADNRPLDIVHLRGQDGPALVGTRNNAAGVNLNRDYMRQQAPEMRLLQTRVCQPWNPHLTLDCHATNGSIHRFALTYDIPHTEHSGRSEPVAYLRDRMMPAVQAAVKRTEGLDTFWYGNFVRDEGGQGQGWITYTHHPRFGCNYRGLTNRLDVLLEAYSYISFEARVQVTYAVLREALHYVAAHGAEIVQLLADCAEPPEQIAIRYALEAVPGTTVDVLTREPYTLQGAPVSVQVPHFAHFVPTALVQRPWGYAMPAAVAEHLQGHGLLWTPVAAGTRLQVEVPTLVEPVAEPGPKILEAQASTYWRAHHERTERALPEGWCVVPTGQRLGAIAVYACEAESDDGLVANGILPPPVAGEEMVVWRVLQAP
ncbi:MAG: peptidase [Acidovorax sp.]|nr:peptidase [Acidovorax sp.]